MTSREENVLTARDPSVEDENDWPEFTLLDVRILQPGRSRYANLLFASPESPVQVTGRLDEVDEGQESLGVLNVYIHNTRRTHPIGLSLTYRPLYIQSSTKTTSQNAS